MCGIVGALLRKPITNTFRNAFNKASSKISHRGPDRSTCISFGKPINAMLDFKRLAILDPSTSGDQPFKYEEGDRTIYTMCN